MSDPVAGNSLLYFRRYLALQGERLPGCIYRWPGSRKCENRTQEKYRYFLRWFCLVMANRDVPYAGIACQSARTVAGSSHRSDGRYLYDHFRPSDQCFPLPAPI